MVWWDPLELVKENGIGSRLTELLKADEQMVRTEQGIRAHNEWQTGRASVRQAAARPQWTVVTATAHAVVMARSAETEGSGHGAAELSIAEAGMATAVSEVTVESVAIDFVRPHGKRFGTLVHAVLSVVALDSEPAGAAELARVQGRIFGATDEEVAAATETVNRALRHPIMQRAAAAAAKGDCRREVPIAMKLEDGVMIEGVVDLAFRGDHEGLVWTVIDYKTDFEIAGKLSEYRHQVGLYALAISRASGQKARAVLLRI